MPDQVRLGKLPVAQSVEQAEVVRPEQRVPQPEVP